MANHSDLPSQDASLVGRRVLITGAASGIGAVAAARIVARGGRVCIMDTDEARSAETARTLGTDLAIPIAGDVTDEAAVETALDAMTDAWGGIDDLVNNAGTYDHGALLELSAARWRRVLDVNLMAPIVISCAAVRRMPDGGAIVNVSSVLGQVIAPERGPYCISKAALISLTKLQAVEWAPRKIRVNAIAPGYILNDTTKSLIETGSFSAEAICRRTPLGRLGTEDEVAEGICFLLDPLRAAYVTGHVLEVNGGWTAYGYV